MRVNQSRCTPRSTLLNRLGNRIVSQFRIFFLVNRNICLCPNSQLLIRIVEARITDNINVCIKINSNRTCNTCIKGNSVDTIRNLAVTITCGKRVRYINAFNLNTTTLISSEVCIELSDGQSSKRNSCSCSFCTRLCFNGSNLKLALIILCRYLIFAI